MRVLDLFAGLGGWSAAFRERGHEVVTIDLDERFDVTLHADIFELRAGELVERFGRFDVILASPPCEAFSPASIGHHWGGGARAYVPKTEHARASIELVRATLTLIEHLAPRWWWMENPRGVLRKLPVVAGLRREVVWYCRYGDTSAKPTDLWGSWPATWEPRPKCRNKRKGKPMDYCHHERAERGAKTGTQGKAGAAARAVVPYELSLDVCIATELALAGAPAVASRLFS